MYNIKNQNLINELKTQVDNHDVISFDIFDTLLLRAYTQPEDLFYHLEQLNNEEEFAPKRIFADRLARQRNPQCEEININQIYDVLGSRYAYLKQQELDMEEAVLTTNPEMLEVYNYAKQQGKKVIIASDMYLPLPFIKKILEKNGFNGYYKIYLSSYFNKRKSTGALYQHILQDLKIAPNRILHVGDNHHSDIEVALSLGFSTFYYEKIMNRFFQINQKAGVFYQKNVHNIGASIILSLSAIKSLSCTNNYWKNLGYNYAGPIMYGFAQWLHQNFKEKGIKDALFVARDGYTLKEIFDLLKDDDMKSHYFYAPRLLYLAIQLSPESKISCVELELLNSTRFILDYYKNKHPFLKENTPDISNANEGISFIHNNIELYRQLGLEEVKGYIKYIESENIAAGDIAIIDSLTSSFSSQKLISSFMVNNTVHGYYWFYTKRTSYELPEFYCKAFQKGDKVMDCWDFMEFIFSSPEPPVQSVVDCKPQYKQDISDYEKLRMDRYPLVAQGALEFASDVQQYFKTQNIFINDKILMDLVYILNQMPDENDIKNFADMYHGVDSNHTQYFKMFENWDKMPINQNI